MSEPAAPADIPAPAPAQRPFLVGMGVAAVIAVGAMGMAYTAQQRVKLLEKELVQRLQQSQGEAGQALILSRQAQDAGREASAKVALLEARLAEVALQRSQLEELIQSLSRSRDENLLADVEAAIRVAQQQGEITGSAQPMLNTLRQADERLARYSQPRLERVRRAVLRDIDRVKAAGVVDLPSLVIRLDEVVRQVDELPLMATPPGRAAAASAGTAAAAASGSPSAASKAAGAMAQPPAVETSPGAPWWAPLASAGLGLADRIWSEARALVRISRIDHPEALLMAPEQSFHLRENLKLRLINARLALMSRQFDVAQSDLRDCQQALTRYFDGGSRRVGTAQDLLQQVAQQARQVTLPRPDETLAALAAAAAGR